MIAMSSSSQRPEEEVEAILTEDELSAELKSMNPSSIRYTTGADLFVDGGVEVGHCHGAGCTCHPESVNEGLIIRRNVSTGKGFHTRRELLVISRLRHRKFPDAPMPKVRFVALEHYTGRDGWDVLSNMYGHKLEYRGRFSEKTARMLSEQLEGSVGD